MRLLLGLAAIWLAMQGVPTGLRQNPPVDRAHTLEALSAPPPEVAALLERSCRNCHSNETHFPWYSQIAPVSWMIALDVEQGRKALNFSEWEAQTHAHPATQAASLMAACVAVQQGVMPKPQYLLLHPEARLSTADKETFCRWTAQESSRRMAAAHGAIAN